MNYDQTEEEKTQLHWEKMEAESIVNQQRYLRDQFAMAALTGLIVRLSESVSAERLSDSAYQIADAMMIAREAK